VGIRRRVELVATASADELSLRSLAEISAITADQNVRIIGGQMASLRLAADWPAPAGAFGHSGAACAGPGRLKSVRSAAVSMTGRLSMSCTSSHGNAALGAPRHG
jgi:hypothetical protein